MNEIRVTRSIACPVVVTTVIVSLLITAVVYSVAGSLTYQVYRWEAYSAISQGTHSDYPPSLPLGVQRVYPFMWLVPLTALIVGVQILRKREAALPFLLWYAAICHCVLTLCAVYVLQAFYMTWLHVYGKI